MMLRGINRQDIFEDDEDYRMFIRILSGIVAREGHGEGHEGHGDRHLTLSRVKGPVPMTHPMTHPVTQLSAESHYNSSLTPLTSDEDLP